MLVLLGALLTAAEGGGLVVVGVAETGVGFIHFLGISPMSVSAPYRDLFGSSSGIGALCLLQSV